MLNNNQALPPLRQDIRLESDSYDRAGNKRWRIYDPCQHRFFQLCSDDIQLLAFWQVGTVDKLKTALERTGQTLNAQQLEGLLSFLSENNLTKATGNKDYRHLQEQHKRVNPTGLARLFSPPKIIQFPLFSPLPIIHFLQPSIELIGHRVFISIWLFITLFGVYLTTRQWDVFVSTFTHLFSVQGFLTYGVSLILLKFIHELGHAYVAHIKGGSVGKMGISLFMGLPMFYTELAGINRIRDPHQRMWVATGGVAAETLIAGIATLAWALLPEGILRSIAFILCTTSWLTTILINLNPLSRFDGYYFLSDWLKIENLQPRALAFSRWYIRRLIVGQALEQPEPMGKPQIWLFSLYGMLVWFYQISLMMGISYLVYSFADKTIGCLFFVYTLSHYLVAPIYRLIKDSFAARQLMSVVRRLFLLIIAAGVSLLLLLPLEHSTTVPSIMSREQLATIHPPENAKILSINAKNGDYIAADQIIMAFSSPELEYKTTEAILRYNVATERLNRISGSAKELTESVVIRQQQIQAKMDVEGLAQRAEKLLWRAPASGIIVDIPEQIGALQWVRPDNQLGRIVSNQSLLATAYLPENVLNRLQPTRIARFIPEEPSLPVYTLKLVDIEESATEFISDISLSSQFGGPIASYDSDSGQPVPVVAQHKVRFTVNHTMADSTTILNALRGHIELEIQPESIAHQMLKQVWKILMTELRG